MITKTADAYYDSLMKDVDLDDEPVVSVSTAAGGGLGTALGTYIGASFGYGKQSERAKELIKKYDDGSLKNGREDWDSAAKKLGYKDTKQWIRSGVRNRAVVRGLAGALLGLGGGAYLGSIAHDLKDSNLGDIRIGLRGYDPGREY